MLTPDPVRTLRKLAFALCLFPGTQAHASAPAPDAGEPARASPSLEVPFFAVGGPRAAKGPLFGNSVYNPRPCPVVESGVAR